MWYSCWRKKHSHYFSFNLCCIECFHMMSRRPYWCPKTMKRRPCWCPKPILWELNSFLMQTLSFVSVNLHRCWAREWKHSIWDCWTKTSPNARQISKMLNCEITTEKKGDRRILFYFFDHQYNSSFLCQICEDCWEKKCKCKTKVWNIVLQQNTQSCSK